MKPKYIYVLSIILSMLLLLSCLTGCTEKDSPIPQPSKEQVEQSDLQQADSKLLTELFELLQINEEVYSYIFRIMEYTEAYGQNNSWDSLLKARASASAALVAIRQMELPTLDLAEDEITVLIDKGVEVNAVQREFEALQSWHSSKDDTASLFCYTLEDDVFMKASVEDAIPAMAEFYQDYFVLEYRYLCYFVNYMLIQMDSVDTWQLWINQLPYMAACADVCYHETSELEAATGLILNEMEALQAQMGSFLGTSEYTLGIVQEAVETGNLDALQREINEIKDVPGYFPIPNWLPDVVNLYLVTDLETQEKRLVNAGEELDTVPSACYISCGTISLDNVTAYGDYLAQWDIETYSTWNEAKDTWQLLANSGSSTMMIEWTEDETLLYLTEPVGCLIPDLYLYAMTMQ